MNRAFALTVALAISAISACSSLPEKQKQAARDFAEARERLRDWIGIDNSIFYDPQKVAIIPMGYCYPGKGSSGDLPPRRSPWLTPALANDVHAKAFGEQLERAVPTPKVPEWERIATEMRLIGEEVANGRMGVEEAAAELDRRTDKILEKRRWMLDEAERKADAP